VWVEVLRATRVQFETKSLTQRDGERGRDALHRERIMKEKALARHWRRH